jgi:hypothetical protein
VAWYDKKPVHLLSSLNTTMFSVIRKVKSAAAGFSKIRVRCPTVIYWYNKGMGGTDLCDQGLSYYRNTMRSSKWQVRIFCYLLQLCALNAHVLYKLAYNLKRGQRGYRQKDFVEELISGLIGVTSNIDLADYVDDDTPVARGQKRGADDEADDDDGVSVMKYIRLGSALERQPSQSDHHPMKWSSRALDERGRRVDMRPHCKLCNARASYSCECCRVALCLDGKDGKPSCWKLYHTN